MVTTSGGCLKNDHFSTTIELLNFRGESCSANKRGGVNIPSVVFGDTHKFSQNHSKR